MNRRSTPDDIRVDGLGRLDATLNRKAQSRVFRPIVGDASSPADSARALAETAAAFGRVDILVNNAGIGPAYAKHDMSHPGRPRFFEANPEGCRRTLEVNNFGPFLMAHTVVPHMVQNGWGRNINVTTGFNTMVAEGFCVYGPSKAMLLWAKERWHNPSAGIIAAHYQSGDFMNNSAITTATLVLAMALAPFAGAEAAELKALVGGSMTDSMKELGPRFERATGHKLTFQFAGTPDLIKQATSGAPFDLGVVPVDVMKDAAARAKFAETTNIAHVGYGVAYRAGAAKPDVSTPDALKQALLKAQSITLYPESAAGAYVMKVFDRLGIGEAMKAKIKPQSPGQIASAAAKGDAELAVFLTNLLAAPGVELAGPFPGDLQQDLVFLGAVSADSMHADAAKAFLTYLKTPEAIAVFKSKGVTPG